MALPTNPDARPFYRSAFQRFDDSQFLLAGGRTTASLYLAGYGVECIVKALILSLIPDGERSRQLVLSFCGSHGHDFEWLNRQYIQRGGPPFPKEIARAFALVSTWSTSLRYQPRAVPPGEAAAFLRATQVIMQWADGRL